MIGCLLLSALVTADPVSVVPKESRFEWLYQEVDFAEGPAAGLDGAIYFSDIPTGKKPGRILKYDPKTNKVSVFVADSQKSNGTYVDAAGNLVVCEGADFGGRGISRYNSMGVRQSLVDRFDGRRFNAPNDICVDTEGRIWFSDPKYLGDEPRELGHRSVYRLDPDGSIHLALSQPKIQKPNGVHVSTDGTKLYVADTNDMTETDEQGKQAPGNMHLVAFAIAPDGTIGERLWTHDFAPDKGVDGMTLDVDGRIYAAVRSETKPGIYVFSPQGQFLERIDLPETPTNCIFGRGPQASTLYITFDKGFGRIVLNAKGYHLPAMK